MYSLPSLYQPTEDKKVADYIYATKINGLYYIAHKTFVDERGFFSELARIPEIEDVTRSPFIVKQASHARSNTNVVRGIHAEDWSKYIQVIYGLCFSVLVDVRPDSKTFKEKEYFLLGHGDQALDGSLFLPPRIGNSVCAWEGPIDYVYMVDKLYTERDPAGDLAISLFDPDLNIEWPIPREQMIISERDQNSITLREKYPERFQ